MSSRRAGAKVIGYDRYEREAALAQPNRVHEVLRLWTNHWQPVMKLVGKERSVRFPRRHRLDLEHARLRPLASNWS